MTHETFQDVCEKIATGHNAVLDRGGAGIALPHFAGRHVTAEQIFEYDRRGELSMIWVWRELLSEQR